MCIASLRSMTLAIKAKKALNQANIFAEIVKLDPNMTKKGCAYGINFNCLDLIKVQDVLNRNQVKYSEILNK